MRGEGQDSLQEQALAAGIDHRRVSGGRRSSDGRVSHFEKKDLPPLLAFWSVTMYDEERLQAANELNRFAIGDRNPLVSNADGSLDLLIQHEAPANDKKANWLPAPQGLFNLCMRLYYPKPEALDGRWLPPGVHATDTVPTPAVATA